MGCNQGIHISFKAQFSINRFLIKLNLYKAIRVCTYDKVYLSPVNHYHLFNVVNYIGQLLSVDLISASVILTWFEITVQNLVFMKPFGLQDLVVCHLIWVVIGQVWQYVVSFGIWVCEAVLVFPCTTKKMKVKFYCFVIFFELWSSSEYSTYICIGPYPGRIRCH